MGTTTLGQLWLQFEQREPHPTANHRATNAYLLYRYEYRLPNVDQVQMYMYVVQHHVEHSETSEQRKSKKKHKD